MNDLSFILPGCAAFLDIVTVAFGSQLLKSRNPARNFLTFILSLFFWLLYKSITQVVRMKKIPQKDLFCLRGGRKREDDLVKMCADFKEKPFPCGRGRRCSRLKEFVVQMEKLKKRRQRERAAQALSS